MDRNDRLLLIYTTFETAESARSLGRGLVGARLAACVNIIDAMTAIYEWDSTINEASEVVMIVKTSSRCLGEALSHLKTNHPYETPALIVIDPCKVDDDFAMWIGQQTGGN